jgi:hypothetical protein
VQIEDPPYADILGGTKPGVTSDSPGRWTDHSPDQARREGQVSARC